jgi:hypothetical protein
LHQGFAKAVKVNRQCTLANVPGEDSHSTRCVLGFSRTWQALPCGRAETSSEVEEECGLRYSARKFVTCSYVMKEVSPGAPHILASLHHVFRVSSAQSKSHNHIYRFNRSRVDSQMIINPVSNPPTMLTAPDQLAMAACQSWLVIPSSDPHPVARPDLQHLLREAMAEIEGLEHWPSSQN